MKKSSRHSNSKARAIYLGMITMAGAAALSVGVAVGFLINVHSYMHFQAVNDTSANAIAAKQGDSHRAGS